MSKLTTEDTEATEWRSARETLPDDGEAVIIHTLLGEVEVGFLDGEVWRYSSGGRVEDDNSVQNWMPLPNPPEGVK